MNFLHSYAIFLKNIFLIRKSFPRIFGLLFWVTFELFFWGFITFWLSDLSKDNPELNFALILITALIFWDIFIRAQHAFSFRFLEDIWARNVVNIFASPIKPRELIMGFVLLSIVEGIFAFAYVSILATLLYTLDIWNLGFYIIPFFVNIFIFGWALGLVTMGLVIRFGPSVEVLVFAIPFSFLPFSAVYYPVSAFPVFVQKIAFFLPTMHLFEGMRKVILEQILPLDHILWASGLNIAYFILGLLFFYWILHIARKRGLIARLITD